MLVFTRREKPGYPLWWFATRSSEGADLRLSDTIMNEEISYIFFRANEARCTIAQVANAHNKRAET